VVGKRKYVAGITTTEDKAESKHESGKGYHMKLVDQERTKDFLSSDLFCDRLLVMQWKRNFDL
jgi:hypothetical protein